MFGRKNPHFRWHYLFLENGTFSVTVQNYQTLQKSRFQQAQGKTQNGTFGCKSVILGRGLERGFYYLWYTKAVLCWKHNFIVLSAKHSFAECKLKNRNLQKPGGCLPTCTKAFFVGFPVGCANSNLDHLDEDAFHTWAHQDPHCQGGHWALGSFVHSYWCFCLRRGGRYAWDSWWS